MVALMARRPNGIAKPSDADAPRTFTSRKLDWLNAMASDARVTDRDHRVACRVAEALNELSGVAILSDALILDDVPTVSDRWQLNDARKRLEHCGWWSVERGSGRRGSRYRMLETKVNDFLGQRIEKRDARNEAQKRRIANEPHGNRDVVTPPHRHENGRGQSTTLEVVGTPPIHLQTPSLGSQGRKKGIEVVEFSACARSTERDDRPNDAEVAQADVDERAAILEFDAGVPRARS